MKKHEHSGSTRKTFENPKDIMLIAGVGKGEVILDIGSGSGYLSVAAAEIVGIKGKVYALDALEESIKSLATEISDAKITNIKPILADAAQRIPLDRESLDKCLISNVLHGFVANDEIKQVMANVNEVLKDKGKLIVIDFKKLATSYGPPLSIRLSPDEVSSLLEPYGYDLIKKFDIAPFHYGIVFQKFSLQGKNC